VEWTSGPRYYLWWLRSCCLWSSPISTEDGPTRRYPRRTGRGGILGPVRLAERRTIPMSARGMDVGSGVSAPPARRHGTGSDKVRRGLYVSEWYDNVPALTGDRTFNLTKTWCAPALTRERNRCWAVVLSRVGSIPMPLRQAICGGLALYSCLGTVVVATSTFYSRGSGFREGLGGYGQEQVRGVRP